MGEIVFKDVCKSFGTTKVIENLNLTIKDGSFTVLVGASGCGKTTLLRMIAGIGPQTSGQIWIDGVEMSCVPASKRGIAMVFQNYAIYPTMTVEGNIEFALINNKVPKAERKRRIAEVAETVGLTEHLKKMPSALSGGQRQRVALARAMVKEPAVFLMDEPLSNLDAKLRVQMRSELIELHNRLKTTFVYVTHDQSEAMSMADTIILMDRGEIQQEASPEVIYQDPNNIFTARFVGTPPMNVLPVPGESFFVGYRPEHILLLEERTGGGYERDARILTREMMGSETHYKVQLPAAFGGKEENIMVKSARSDFAVGEQVIVHVEEENLYFFDAAEKRIRQDDTGNYRAYVEKVCRLADRGGRNENA